MLISPATIGAIQQDPIRRIFKQASLDLRFADDKSLVDATTGASLVTFTRASSGTFVGSDGVLRTAVTNLVLRSEEFDNASWPKTGTPTVTANSSVSPDGTTTAELFTRTTTGSTFIQQILVKAASALTYTFSVYAKQSVGNFIALRTQGTYPARADVVFNLGTGAIASAASVVAGFASASATITPLVNGWYRLTLTATTDAVTNFQAVVSVNSNGGQVDGTDSVSNSACFLWGAQLEQSTTVGEYIPTTSVINSAPRFDHNPTTGESLGLLVEEQRTNLLLNSATLSTQSVTVAAAANTLSFYGTGTVTLTGVSTAGPLVGTGANNRVSLTFTPTVGVLILTVSGSVTNAQLEAGAFPTSYIPTTTAAATRSADVASITGTAFSSWYQEDEGTVFIEGIVSPGLSSFPWFYNISDGTTNNSIGAYQFTSGIYGAVVASGTTATPNPAVLFTPVSGTAAKHAFAVKTSDTRAAYNATLSVAQTSTVMPVVSQLSIGQSLSSNRINSTIKRLVYWGQRLPNNVLQAITQ